MRPNIYSILVFLFFLPLFSAGQDNTTLERIEVRIDSIMNWAIDNEAFPGSQLLALHKGELIFHKTYGYHTYDSLVTVQKDDIYDLASVTKIFGPLLGIMKLYEEGVIDLDKPFSTYWKSWKRISDKKEITLRELLAHQAGMEPYIVFLNEAGKNGKFKKRFIRRNPSSRFSKQIADGLFANKRFDKFVFRKIKRSKVRNEKKYLYSGLGSLIYPKLIETLSETSYEEYLKKNFYDPIGCQQLGYNPVSKGWQHLVPTEEDTLFRKTLVKGWVHDENAALLGGVSGNAGLFGTATDVAKIMQMLLDKGSYNDKQILKETTVNEFIRIQYPENDNRRGLGFDKPLIGNDTLSIKDSYPAPEVSAKSFGHAGFTGTFVWADPDYDLVFVFLSNRVYPSRTHRNIYNLNIRPKLQRVFYQELFQENEFINN